MIEMVAPVVLGFALGWFANWQKSIISENANIINEHIEDIKAFSDVLREYWLSSSQSLDDELLAAAKVKALHAGLAAFYGEAGSRLSLKRFRTYQVQQLRLFEAGLGGGFETNGRKYDASRAIECCELSSELIHTLRLARKEQLSVWLWLVTQLKRIGFSKPD